MQIINAGWLIDGSGNSIRTKAQLRVVNGRIDAVRENWLAHPAKMADNPDVETLDLKNATIEETVRCATFNGAQLLGIKDLGLLVPGMPATFIAVKGDPSGLPDSLKRLQGIWVKGEMIG